MAFAIFLATVSACGGGSNPLTTTAPPDLASPPPTVNDLGAPIVDMVAPGDDSPPPLPLGASCSSAAECASGFCADGVCCASACGGCLACNLPGSIGSCAPVADGSDPHGACAQPCAAGCHAGACVPASSGTVCSKSCSDGTSASTLTAQACDGKSLSCSGAISNTPCGEYACGSKSACNVTCAVDGDCIHGYYCKAQQCVPAQGNGSPCTRPAECASNVCNGTCVQCVYNYQCTSASSPQCNGGTCGNCSAGFTGRGVCYSGGEVSCGDSSQCMRAFGPACNNLYSGDCGCGTHGWCPPGTLCTGSDLSASCLLQAGSPCHLDGECLSGACVNRACALHRSGQACIGNGDCASGSCVNQTCG